jgi:hypothetical protein
MAGLDPAIQTSAFGCWVPGSNDGKAKDGQNEIQLFHDDSSSKHSTVQAAFVQLRRELTAT